MKRFIIIFSVLAVLLFGALFVAPGFVDWNKYKPQILAQLHEATGHEYSIEGALDLAVLPYPHVSIGKLSVATPTTSGSYNLLVLDKASVQLALFPLFSGDVVVSKLVLEKPVFQIAIGANGAQSWMTPILKHKTGKKQDSSGAFSGLGNAVALNEITIKDGSFSFTDFRSGRKVALADINMTLQGDSLYGPYSLSGVLAYDDHKTELKLNSGRLDNLAESIAVQLDLAFPDLGASISYAGVVAVKEQLELQGETGIKAQDMAAFLEAFATKAPAYLKKQLSSKGILTLMGNELAYRNLKLGFAGVESAGYVVLKNFKKDAKGPLDADINLEVTKPYALEKLLPAAEKQDGGLKGFLPESVTIPKDMTGAVNIKSAEVQFGGTSFKDVAFSLERKKTGWTAQVNLKAPGKTALDVNSSLSFASQSKSAQDGSVTFSDPEMVIETNLISGEPLVLSEALLKGPLSQNTKNLLSEALTSEARFSVKPRVVEINDSFVKLAETRMNAKGKYTLGTGGQRDLLNLTVSNFGLDVDKWMKKIKGHSGSDAAKEGQKPDVAAIVKNIALPFDMEFLADIQSVHLKGRDYTRFATKGEFLKSQLLFDTLSLTSNAGDTFVVAGGVKDLSALQGIDFSLQANILDLVQMLESFGIATERLPGKIGRAELLAEIKGAPENLAFTTNLKAMRASMEAAGEIADALSAAKVSDLTLRLKHPNYVELARIYNPSFNSGVAIKKNLDIFASMSRKEDVYSFTQLQATIGPARITGDIVADVSGQKPAITAALKLTDLPIDDLLGIRTSRGGGGSVRSQPLRKTQDVRWSRDAINTEIMHVADIALKATANTISYGNWNFTNAGVNLDLKDGNLDIKQLDGGLYGGHVAMTGSLKSSAQPRQPLSFAGDLLVQEVDLAQFVKSFSGSQLVKAKGAVSLETKVQSAGLSPAALIFDLNGKGTANGKDIVFEGFDLARLSRALADPSSSFTENFTRLMDASMGGGYTKFDTLDSAYTITEGVIKFEKLDMDGPDASVVTRGNVSLPLWSVDLESTVQLKDPVDAPPLRASFKGPIDKPAQTFGENAMQQYFQKQIEGAVLSPLLDKIDDSGALQNLLGLPPTKQPQQPAPEVILQPEAQQQKQPQQQKPQQKEITPEDAIFGVIDGLFGGQ